MAGLRDAGYYMPRLPAKIGFMLQRSIGMSSAVDRRELALKATAGLIGAAIGWLPVELASHGHSLTEALSPEAQIAEFAAMAVLAGMIGGMIVAAEGKSHAITPATR